MVTVRAEPYGDRWRCEVTVDQDGRRTRHAVTVTADDLERWGKGAHQANVEELVARSFEFLLEREPADSILRSFDLSVIARYFPEYDQVFKRR
jgi:hypothetical protein